MAKKVRPLSVLFIDDKEDEMVEFKTLARQNRIIIRTAHKSAESGLDELSSNLSKYQAVILDAKAFRKKDQVAGTENFGSLRDCINGIKEIERNNKRKIPFCVYTGHIETMGEAWEDDLKVFVKGEQQEEMFAYLKEEMRKLPETETISRYSDVFELFDKGYLDLDYREKLLFVLMNYESRQKQELEGALTQIRKILEGIYKALGVMGRIDPQLLPNNRPNLEWCQRYISGLDIDELDHIPSAIVPAHIGWALKVLKENSSAAGAHDYEDSVHNFTLKTMVFSLLDVLLWFKNFAKKNS